MKNVPVITISRQYGSRGHEIGQRIAEKLSIPYYDKSLIALAAKKSGFSEAAFEYADEKAGSSLLYSMVTSGMGVAARIAGTPEMPINDKLFLIQSDIIRNAANEAPAVIVGRCATIFCANTATFLKFLFTPTRMPVSATRSRKMVSMPTKQQTM